MKQSESQHESQHESHWRLLSYVGLGLLIIAPWAVGYLFLSVDKVNFSCESRYEILHELSAGESVRTYGVMSSMYNKKGTGVGRYVGTVVKSEPDGMAKASSVHRIFDFTYELIGSYARIHSGKVSKYLDDNAPDNLVEEYVYRGFKSGEVEYFQVLGMGAGGIASGIGGMPRIYCGVTPH